MIAAVRVVIIMTDLTDLTDSTAGGTAPAEISGGIFIMMTIDMTDVSEAAFSDFPDCSNRIKLLKKPFTLAL